MDSFFVTPQIGLSGNLAIYDWPAPDSPTRGRVLLVHGLGEHMGRYTELAEQLRTWGFAVRGYDQYGHGQSAGPRGDMKNERSLLGDLGCVLDETRKLAGGAHKPLIVLGHSMGGLVTSAAVAENLRPVDGLVLSSPALATDVNALQKILLKVMPKMAPHLCVDNGLKAQFLARDPEVVQAYRQDPMVHRQISAGLAQWIVQQGQRVRAAAGQWATPTLLMYAGQDRLVAPRGSAEFAALSPPCVLTHVFEDMYHEIFNDPQREIVLETLKDWLDEHFSL